jgi:hypothetical protein
MAEGKDLLWFWWGEKIKEMEGDMKNIGGFSKMRVIQ